MTLSEFVMLLKPKIDEKSQAKAKESIQELNNAAAGLKAGLTRALGMIGIGLSLRSMNALIESFNQANDSLRGAIDSSEDLAQVTDDVRKAANEARVSYEQMASSVSKTASLDIFNADEAVQYSANLNKLLQAHGHGDYATSVQQQLNRIMQTGNVSSGFTRQLANTPEILELMAKQLGVNKDQLADMAKQGKITAQTIKDAFLNGTDAINEAFAQTDIMFTDALKVVRNNWGFFLNELNDATGIGNELGHLIVDASNKVHDFFMRAIPYAEKFTKAIGGSRNMLKLLGITIAGLGAAGVIGNFSKIVTALSSVGKILGIVNAEGKVALLQMAKIILIVGAILLIIDDIVNFMQGNDSLIGEMCKKAGIDADNLRERFQTAWESIKKVGKQIMAGAARLFAAIAPYLLKLLEIVGTGLAYALRFLADCFEEGKNAILETVEAVKSAWQWLKDLWDVVVGITKEKFHETIDKWRERFDKIREVVENVKNKILEIIDLIANSALGQLVSGGINLITTGLGGSGSYQSERYIERNSTTNNSTTNNNTSNTNVNMTFNGTDSNMAKQAGRAVQDVLNSGSVARGVKNIPV